LFGSQVGYPSRNSNASAVDKSSQRTKLSRQFNSCLASVRIGHIADDERRGASSQFGCLAYLVGITINDDNLPIILAQSYGGGPTDAKATTADNGDFARAGRHCINLRAGLSGHYQIAALSLPTAWQIKRSC
jgi:hypothetical protein